MKTRDSNILARNRKIDKNVVAAGQKLEHKMKMLGVDEKKPKYTLEPPLGQKRASIHIWNG